MGYEYTTNGLYLFESFLHDLFLMIHGFIYIDNCLHAYFPKENKGELMSTISLIAVLIKFLMKYTLKSKYKSINDLRSQTIGTVKQLQRLFPGTNIKIYKVDEINTAFINPAVDTRNKAILFLHGGGFVTGGIKTHLHLCITLANSLQTTVILPEYRLAPENPFPAALDDAEKIFLWMIKDGFKPENITLMGDSAGGGLALSLIQILQESSNNLPFAVVCLSPWADLTLSGDSIINNASAEIILRKDELADWADFYTIGSKKTNPLISPLFANYNGFPKILIQVGSDEMLLDDACRVHQNAEKAGTFSVLRVWDGMWHDWHLFGNLIPEARKAIAEIKEFLE